MNNSNNVYEQNISKPHALSQPEERKKEIQTFTCATSFSHNFPFLIVATAAAVVCASFACLYSFIYCNFRTQTTTGVDRRVSDTAACQHRFFAQTISWKVSKKRQKVKFSDKCKMSWNHLNQSPNCLFKHLNKWRKKCCLSFSVSIRNSIYFRIKNRAKGVYRKERIV